MVPPITAESRALVEGIYGSSMAAVISSPGFDDAIAQWQSWIEEIRASDVNGSAMNGTR